MKMAALIIGAVLLNTVCYAQESDENLGLHADGGHWKFTASKNYNPELPDVLLIGDSIMIGYRAGVIRSLEGKANVDHWATPDHLKTITLHEDLEKVVSYRKYDVIHFNIGLHGWSEDRVPEREYSQAMASYVEAIQEYAPQAALIWASITPVHEKETTRLHEEINPVIVRRNTKAAAVMEAHNVSINDLYSLLIHRLELVRGDQWHWKPEAYALMAEQVVSHIQDDLEKRSKKISFFVSPGGKDSNPGTPEAPFKSLERARTAVRAASPAVHRTVILLPGRYPRQTTFELNQQDSGTAEFPVVYKAEEAGTVFIDGGIVVSAGSVSQIKDVAIKSRLIEDIADQMLQIDLKKEDIQDFGTFGPRGFRRAYIPASMELFINHKAQTVARWPNKGVPSVKLGKVIDAGSIPREGDFSLKPGVFEYNTDRPERWTKADDLYISGLFCYGYADDTLKVAKIDTKKSTLTTARPHLYGFAQKDYTAWYAVNLIEEIDLPGEYAVDRESGLLLFLPPADFSSESLIQLSIMEEVMVALEESNYVHFENIVFENSRGSAVYIEGGKGNLFAGCTFRNLGILAVQMGRGIEPFPYGEHDGCGNKSDGKPGVPAPRIMGSWHEYIYRYTAWNRNAGTDHRIQSCDIYSTGAGGIMLGGGDRKTLTPGNNTVENCNVYDVNRLDRTYKTPINVDGVGNRIRHNRIHDCEGMAIYLHGNDHLIEFNHIYHVLKDISDQGAIYMGRDPSESGNMIRHNFLHDIYDFHESPHGVEAIYFDDHCTYGATIYGNVFVRAGQRAVVLFNNGGQSPLINNIIVDCPPRIEHKENSTEKVRTFMKSPLGQARVIEAVDITKPPYSTKYPVVTQIYNGEREVKFPDERNYVVKGDYSQFVDPENGDFSLRKDSTVYGNIEGFEPIPFKKIGLYVDAWREELPNREYNNKLAEHSSSL